VTDQSLVIFVSATCTDKNYPYFQS